MAVQPFEEIVVIVGGISLFMVTYLLSRSFAHRAIEGRRRHARQEPRAHRVELQVDGIAQPKTFEEEVSQALARLSRQMAHLEVTIASVNERLQRKVPTFVVEVASILAGFAVSLIGTALLQPLADEYLPTLLVQVSTLFGA